MKKVDDDATLTLDDEEIVTRRQAIGLAAVVLGVGTLASSQAFADDSEESDDSSEASDDSSESSDDSEEESDGDGS
ncbi:MAG: hypothetical protein AAF563_10380 [Pseudomonadota bacterium]